MSSVRRSTRIRDQGQPAVADDAAHSKASRASNGTKKPAARTKRTSAKVVVDSSRNKSDGTGSKKRGRASEPDVAAVNLEPQPVDFVLPSTPVKKRARGEKSTKLAPATPTPAQVNLLAPTSSPIVGGPRPAAPHIANAPLSTPGGSKVLAYPLDASPSKIEMLPRPSATTDNILEEACAHLIQVDPALRPLIEKHTCHMFTPQGLAEPVDPFEALASGIIAQQVSGAAARSIKNKFIALFPSPDGADAAADASTETRRRFPQPHQVAPTPLETLRTAGLSQRKAEYIQGLAEKFVAGELNARTLATAGDEEVIEQLVAVRGLGRWSAEMFACFGLRRTDIFSVGDLGVQRGLAIYLGKDVSKLRNKGGKWKYCTEQEMLTHSAKFAPFRSIFMWYLWRLTEVDLEALE